MLTLPFCLPLPYASYSPRPLTPRLLNFVRGDETGDGVRKGDSDSDVGEERVPALLLAATTTRQKDGRKGEKLVIKSTFFPVPPPQGGLAG